MPAMLSQTISWPSVAAGAYYELLVNPFGGGTALKTHDVGQATSVLLSELLAGVDLVANPTVNIHVRSEADAAGSFPSAWSPALSLDIVGFPVPAAPVLDP